MFRNQDGSRTLRGCYGCLCRIHRSRTGVCRVSCIASSYRGVLRIHLDFRNRHIETHQFTPGIYSQRNDTFKKLRAQGKCTANQQAARQPDLQISGRSVQLSQAVQPRHHFNKQRDLFFWIPHVQNRGGYVHHPKWSERFGSFALVAILEPRWCRCQIKVLSRKLTDGGPGRWRRVGTVLGPKQPFFAQNSPQTRAQRPSEGKRWLRYPCGLTSRCQRAL